MCFLWKKIIRLFNSIRCFDYCFLCLKFVWSILHSSLSHCIRYSIRLIQHGNQLLNPDHKCEKKGRKKEHLAKLFFTSYIEYYYGVLFFQRKTKAIFLLKSSALRIFIPRISNLKNQQWPHARDATFCDSFCFVSSVSNTEHIWNSRILEFQELKKLTIIWSLARDATFCDFKVKNNYFSFTEFRGISFIWILESRNNLPEY